MITSNSSPAAKPLSNSFESSENSINDRQQMLTIGEETGSETRCHKRCLRRLASPYIFALALLLLLFVAAAIVIPVTLSVIQTTTTTPISKNYFFSVHSKYHH